MPWPLSKPPQPSAPPVTRLCKQDRNFVITAGNRSCHSRARTASRPFSLALNSAQAAAHLCHNLSGDLRRQLMRLVIRLIILLALITVLVDFDLPYGAQAVKASVIQSESNPKIMNARVSGKKLIVTGENFASDAVIFVNGVKQKTKNDSD